MEFQLSAREARVLGSLLEKEMATPDYYPLSLNALVNACNQKTGRDPVVSYAEDTVQEALDGLKEKRLVWQSDASRVVKFAQNLDKSLNLTRREAAVLCLLLLRGPQTVGELRGRSERLYDFADLAEVADTLKSLTEMELAAILPKQPGRKEARYAQLLTGMVQSPAEDAATAPASGGDAETDRFQALEQQVAELEAALATLQQDFLQFKRQLGE